MTRSPRTHMEEPKVGDGHFHGRTSLSTLYRIIRGRRGVLSESETRSLEATATSREEDRFLPVSGASSESWLRPVRKASSSVSRGAVANEEPRSILRHLGRLSELEKEADETTASQIERIASRLVRIFSHGQNGGGLTAYPDRACQGRKPVLHPRPEPAEKRQSNGITKEAEHGTTKRRCTAGSDDRCPDTKESPLTARRGRRVPQEEKEDDGRQDWEGEECELSAVGDFLFGTQSSTPASQETQGKAGCSRASSSALEEGKKKKKVSRTCGGSHVVTPRVFISPERGEDRLSGEAAALCLSSCVSTRSGPTCSSAPTEGPSVEPDAATLKDPGTCQERNGLRHDPNRSEDSGQESSPSRERRFLLRGVDGSSPPSRKNRKTRLQHPEKDADASCSSLDILNLDAGASLVASSGQTPGKKLHSSSSSSWMAKRWRFCGREAAAKARAARKTAGKKEGSREKEEESLLKKGRKRRRRRRSQEGADDICPEKNISSIHVLPTCLSSAQGTDEEEEEEEESGSCCVPQNRLTTDGSPAGASSSLVMRGATCLKNGRASKPSGEEARESIAAAVAGCSEGSKDRSEPWTESKARKYLLSSPRGDLTQQDDINRIIASFSLSPVPSNFSADEDASKAGERTKRRSRGKTSLTTTAGSRSGSTSDIEEEVSVERFREEGGPRNASGDRSHNATEDGSVVGVHQRCKEKSEAVRAETLVPVESQQFPQSAGLGEGVVRTGGAGAKEGFSFSLVTCQLLQRRLLQGEHATLEESLDGTASDGWPSSPSGKEGGSTILSEGRQTREGRRILTVEKMPEKAFCSAAAPERGGARDLFDKIDSEREDRGGGSGIGAGSKSTRFFPCRKESTPSRSRTVTTSSDTFLVADASSSQRSFGEGEGRTRSMTSVVSASPTKGDISGQGGTGFSPCRSPVFIELSPPKEALPKHSLRMGVGGARPYSGRATPPASRVASTPSPSAGSSSSPLLRSSYTSVPMIRRQLRKARTARQQQRWPVSSGQRRNGADRKTTGIQEDASARYCPGLALITFKSTVCTPVATPRKRARTESGGNVENPVVEEENRLQVEVADHTRTFLSTVSPVGPLLPREHILMKASGSAGLVPQLGEWLTPARSSLDKLRRQSGEGETNRHGVHTVYTATP